MKGKKLAIVTFLFICGCSVIQDQEMALKEEPITIDKQSYFVSVPITLSSFQTPDFDVEIEGTTLSVKLDLGFRGDLTLAKEALGLISDKVFIGEKPMYGIRGKEYTKKLYQIPKLKIGSMAFSPPILQEENPDYLRETTFLENRGTELPQDVGRAGWELFYNTNLLLDFKNSQIAFCDSLDTLKKEGYQTETFIKAPLFLERGLVELEAATSGGPLRCTLDTGATWNILNKEIEEGKEMDEMIWEAENISKYEFFKIEDVDFGPIVFHRIPIHIPIRIDAILGMEFFKGRQVFLDFEKKVAYFSK